MSHLKITNPGCVSRYFSSPTHAFDTPCSLLHSGPFEEYSIRAIFALNQEKVLDEYLVAQGEANEDEIEEEYIQNCNKVVSHT